MELNEEQKAVVEAGAGVFAVFASAGSGKTHSLVHRYCRLIESGVSPDDILCASFSSASAKSMRERAAALIEIPVNGKLSGWMTLHSFCLGLVTRERERFPFSLAEFPLATDTQRYLGEAARHFEVRWKDLGNYISLQKRNQVRPIAAIRVAETPPRKNEKMALAYKRYEMALREAKLLDFDGLIQETVALLEKNEEVRARYSYKYVMLDEAQDADAIQFSLLKLLSQKHGNLLCVGDQNQGIFGFRGGGGQLFSEMQQVFSNTQQLFISQNYRSSPEIVDLCRKVANHRELADKLHTTNSSGPEPSITAYVNPLDEANAIAGKVKADGSTAILARTNKILSGFQNALGERGVKYRLLGSTGFWGTPEIKHVMAYVQCANLPFDGAVMAAMRAPFHPANYVKKKEIADSFKNRNFSEQSAIAFLKGTAEKHISNFVFFLGRLSAKYRNQDAGKAVRGILTDLKAVEYYSEDGSPDSWPADNLAELVKIASRYDSLPAFLDYVRKVSAASRSKKAVVLSTVHGSKGLEWDTVYLVSVNDGVLPHARAESMAEEKNIMYVGVSRAERELNISYSGKPSVFLEPLLKKEEASK